MDFLNKSFTQLKDLFLSMSPGARITAGLLLAVVVISLAYLFTHEVAGPDVYLLRGELFSPRELDNMKMAFGQEGLNSYEIEGDKIRVPRGQREQYMAALSKHSALPPDFDEILIEILEEGSTFMSSGEREVRLRIGLQKYVSRMLSAWPGIEYAHVIYDPKKRGGFSTDTITHAWVSVKPRGNEPLDLAAVASIRSAVVHSISGLKPEHCAVTDENRPGRNTTVGGSDDYGSPHNNPYIANAQHYEKWYKNEILNTLGIPGATVMVYVELDPVHKHQEEEVNYDQRPVTLRTDDTTVTETVESAGPAGRPGYQSQGNTAMSLAGTVDKGTRQEREESQSSQQSVPSTQIIKTEKAGHTLKQVNVAVALPTSYFESVWREQNPAKPGEEPKPPEQADLEPIRTQTTAQIKQLVAAILPEPVGVADRTELVTVAELPDITLPGIPGPGLGEKAFAWLAQHWATLGLIALGFFSLVVLRSMIRAAPGPRAEAAGVPAAPSSAEEAEAESDEKPTARKLKRFSGSGASLRDELSDLVGEDPDTAANILRNWIGSTT